MHKFNQLQVLVFKITFFSFVFFLCFSNINKVFATYNATNELGQTDYLGNINFTSNNANNGFVGPAGFEGNNSVALDSINHRLFVADKGHSFAYNARILVYNLDSNNHISSHSASYVIGQADFKTTGTGTTTQSGFGQGIYLTYDSVDSRLFALDQSNNRVLVFNVSPSSISNGENASYVLGQSDFISSVSTTTQSGMKTLTDLTYDTINSRLFIVDQTNNRVMVFNVSTSTISNGENASYVLGQSSFTSNTGTTTQSGMKKPLGVAYDSVNSRLFVSETDNFFCGGACGQGNNRIIVFNVSTSTISNGEAATSVIGQANFTTETSGTTNALFKGPAYLSYDSVNTNLFVSDPGNNRVLVFPATSIISNGESATNVLGQADFVSSVSATTQSGLRSPSGLAYDSNSNILFISDSSNNRVMEFNVSTTTITNGENATNELGQTDYLGNINFTSNNANNGFVGPAGFEGNNSVALDSINHRLFVADKGHSFAYNARILVYNLDSNNHISSHSASYVIGQADFKTTGTGTTTQSGFGQGIYLTYDSVDSRLFALDQSNNRVLVFNVSPSSISNGENASYVLGQSDFISSVSTTTQSGMKTLTDLTYDTINSRLFIVDQTNNRVMVFNVSTSTISNGENASYVLGQSSFTSNTGTTTQSGMKKPLGVAYDSVNSRLFVSETDNFFCGGACGQGNNRIIVFNVSTSTISNGEAATSVIGQANFTTETSGTTNALFKGPAYLSYDSVNTNLFVSDPGNNRVLVFPATSIISNGESATNVLGQADFVSSVSATTQSGLRSPSGLAYDSNSNILFISDSSNNRVMEFALVNISNNLSDGIIGQSYSQSITTSYNQGTTSLQLISGVLPTGLVFSTTTGIISGTPNTIGTYTFSIEVIDDNGITGTFNQTKTYTITISDAPVIVTPPPTTYSGGGGGSVSPEVLAKLLAPTASTSGVIVNNCPKGLICTPTIKTNSNTFTKVLIKGDENTEVNQLQALLYKLGFLKVSPTGYYGSLTEKAVKAYQTARGIDALGFIGPSTRLALNSEANVAVTPVVTTNTSFTFNTDMELGTENSDVTKLQTLLNTAGFLKVSPTGYFGNQTKAAVKAYQTAHGINSTGYVGPLTRKELSK